jgi:peptidoglycan/xylan/chitin deacetylase (PgdA/CDA1 family)
VIGVFAATTTAALLSAAGWHSMVPKSQLYGRTFIGVNSGSKLLALTYDDGPNDPWTPRLLEVLARHDVRATFFMLGRYVRQRPNIARQVAEAGHAIGNHTFSHPNLIFSSLAQILAQINDCDHALNDAVGEHSKLFRPPFGGRRPDVLSRARREGFIPVMWSVSAYDWNAGPPEKIEHKVASQVRGGDVILMHDGGHLALGTDRSASVAATDRIITRYKSEGYRFVTVPEMMKEARVASG